MKRSLFFQLGYRANAAISRAILARLDGLIGQLVSKGCILKDLWMTTFQNALFFQPGLGGPARPLTGVQGRGSGRGWSWWRGGGGGGLSWSLATVAVGGEIRARLRMQASCIWVLP
jgi:hypothetical protein